MASSRVVLTSTLLTACPLGFKATTADPTCEVIASRRRTSEPAGCAPGNSPRKSDLTIVGDGYEYDTTSKCCVPCGTATGRVGGDQAAYTGAWKVSFRNSQQVEVCPEGFHAPEFADAEHPVVIINWVQY